MSTPWTTAAKASFRRSGVDCVSLLQIDLTIPSSLTLYFANRDVDPLDGHPWETGAEFDQIDDGVDYLGPGPNTILWKFHLTNRVLSQAGGLRLDALLAAYQWRRATVTLWTIDLSLASTFSTNKGQLFAGVIGNVGGGPTKFEFSCTQNLDWDATVPPVVDTTTAPNAPDSALGLPYGIILGDHRKPTPLPPFSASNDKNHDESGGGRLALPLIVTDPGLGTADVHASAACHELKKLFDPTNGHSAFVAGQQGILAPLDAAGVTEHLGSSESYLAIDDGQMLARAAVFPSFVETVAASINNSAGDPRFAMTPFRLNQYATIDQTAAKNRLVLGLPNLGALGEIRTVEVCVGFSPNALAGAGQHLRVRPVNSASGALGTAVLSAGALAVGSAQVLRGTWDGAYWSADWRFRDGAAASVALQVDYDAAAAGLKASIYWAVLIVTFRPSRTMVDQTYAHVKPQLRRKHSWLHHSVWSRPLDYAIDTTWRFEGTLYANCEGAPDDGSGTYTGSAAALIEKPPDLIRWLLVTFGGLHATNDFETAAGGHGSFVDARTILKGAWPDEYRLAPYVGQQMKLSEAVRKVCEQSLASAFLDRFTGKWRLGVWKLGAVADYDIAFTWDMIDVVRVDTLSNIDAVHEIRAKYGFDHLSGRTLFESFVGPDGSSSGYALPSYRDQQPITISAANDKIDFKLDATTYAGAAIAHATYDVLIDLAKAARDGMVAGGFAPSTSLCVGYGFDIKTSYNDSLAFTVGGTPYTATLTAGRYLSGEAFAAEIARAMNAAGSGLTFTCVYAPATSGFTIAAGSAWAVVDDGSGHLSAGWATVGYNAAAAAASSRGTDWGRYVEHFWAMVLDQSASIGAHTNIQFLHGSGANAAANAANELGWLKADTSAASNLTATEGRGVREATAADALADYGPTDPEQNILDYVNDQATAVRWRNRRFDLRVLDRGIIVFRTTFAPDLQRLRHIAFDSSVDEHLAFPRYGTDGSWVGKVFKVLRVTQYPNDVQGHQEITAIEV